MKQSLVVLITGASRGIGAATAAAFVRAGHRVFLAARSEAGLKPLAEKLGTAVTPIACDVSAPRDVEALFDRIYEKEPRLDVVFNNAGLNMKPGDVGETSADEWRRIVSVNLDGAFYVASAAFRRMKSQTPQGGRIINNGSIAAHTPRPKTVAYAASKHAITGLTKSIALDGRPYKIACGQIDIGNCASDMVAAYAGGALQADGTVRAEPTMDAADVAEAVLRMAELPLGANVLFQTIMATNMPFVGRG